MAILKYLNCSMAHLSEKAESELAFAALAGLDIGITVVEYPEGYFLSVPESTHSLKCCDALKSIVRYASEVGCTIVRFDHDAEIDGNLPTFNR